MKMKNLKSLILLLFLVGGNLLIGQTVANKWTKDRCQKISSKITQELTLSKEDSTLFNEIVLEKFVFEQENIKKAATNEEKGEIYRQSMTQFKEKLKTNFTENDKSKKILDWYVQNYKTFNSL